MGGRPRQKEKERAGAQPKVIYFCLKIMSKIKLFRGDQILIPGVKAVFSVEAPKINGREKKKIKARKPRLQKPIQLSLFAPEQSLAAKG